ncbi:MAG: hypothetical protein ACD_34C00408G0004 [uncultured bacterium]|nr:MAG: hypothetical protein ACD_34C00408G0004 [uncultured bacterium]
MYNYRINIMSPKIPGYFSIFVKLFKHTKNLTFPKKNLKTIDKQLFVLYTTITNAC